MPFDKNNNFSNADNSAQETGENGADDQTRAFSANTESPKEKIADGQNSDAHISDGKKSDAAEQANADTRLSEAQLTPAPLADAYNARSADDKTPTDNRLADGTLAENAASDNKTASKETEGYSAENGKSDGVKSDEPDGAADGGECERHEEELPPKRQYDKELLSIIRGDFSDEQINELLSDYHDNDIASVFPLLTSDERKKLYRILGVDAVSDIFSYLEDASPYIDELPSDKAADIIESMDADDAVDALEDLVESKKREIIGLMDKESAEDVNLITRYADDEIGSLMTTNFVSVDKDESVKGAMRKVIAQADKNDNISTIYVTDAQNNNKFYGAIDLRDLVIARSYQALDDIIVTSYPYMYASENISDSLEEIKQYSEDSLPVLDSENKLIGVITGSDVVEAVDDELGEDYAKLAGLTEEDDLTEPIKKSIAKRIPWLIVLLLLDIAIGAYIGLFEAVVVGLPFLVCYQSLILGMSGNVGTQSLAITVRVLSDENVKRKDKLKLMLKEVRVGFFNGLILGIVSALVITAYMYLTNAAGDGLFVTALLSGSAVGSALLLSMTVSSFTGTAVPILLQKFKVDPAVASGPLITTINDLVAVTVYYGFAMLLILELHV